MIQAQAGIALDVSSDLAFDAEQIQVAIHVAEQALSLCMADIGVPHHLLDDQIVGDILRRQVAMDQIDLRRGDAAQVQVAEHLVDGQLIAEQLEAGISMHSANRQEGALRDV